MENHLVPCYKTHIINYHQCHKFFNTVWILLSPWVEERKTDKIWIYGYVGKLKGTGKQGEEKMNDMNIHTISDLQRYVQAHGLPKLPI